LLKEIPKQLQKKDLLDIFGILGLLTGSFHKVFINLLKWAGDLMKNGLLQMQGSMNSVINLEYI
jgi:hypothetical protein